ncbi:ArsR/SmtB family transcription factor [Pseudarthrobacter sp. YS3]|uniref:ArsR/SmtB family transcription factor n=1 Tax=Pseudarthrobacter sp. YS3 TaxID=3453718 RepID=UPI003EEB2FB1
MGVLPVGGPPLGIVAAGSRRRAIASVPDGSRNSQFRNSSKTKECSPRPRFPQGAGGDPSWPAYKSYGWAHHLAYAISSGQTSLSSPDWTRFKGGFQPQSRGIRVPGLPEAKSDLFRSLGHPVRIRVLELLADGPVPVSELRRATDLEASNLSQHLSVLRRQRLITSLRTDGQIRYQLSSREVLTLFSVARCCGTTSSRRASNWPKSPMQSHPSQKARAWMDY